METITLNKFNHCFDKEVENYTTQTEWWENIKQGTYKDEVEFLRSLYNTNRDKYDKLKPSLLPVVNYQFNFDKRLNNDNIIKSTNLLFLEVDGKSHPDFKIEMIDLSKVYVYYKSLSDTGYHIIVKTEGVNKDNFKKVFNIVVKNLGIEKYQDKSAVKMIQPSIISYDPNLYINENPYIFQFCDTLSDEVNTLPIKFNKGLKTSENDKLEYIFKFSNIDEISKTLDFGDNITYTNWDGIDIIECLCLPKTIKDGNRQNALLGYCNNLVILNPDATEEHIFNMMMRVNNSMCINPVDRYRIENIVKSIIKYKYTTGLKPNYTRRKIIFDPTIRKNYTKVEKFEIVNQLLTEKRVNDSKTKLYEIITNWDVSTDGKLSQTKIAQYYGMSKKTVNKYWTEFGQQIKKINDNYKEFKKLYK